NGRGFLFGRTPASAKPVAPTTSRRMDEGSGTAWKSLVSLAESLALSWKCHWDCVLPTMLPNAAKGPVLSSPWILPGFAPTFNEETRLAYVLPGVLAGPHRVWRALAPGYSPVIVATLPSPSINVTPPDADTSGAPMGP